MSQTICSTEGIILRVIPFRDYDQIITIFTPESGLIKVLHKGGRIHRKNGKAPPMPLTKVEVVYREKESEIFSCIELNCIEIFSLLRTDLCFLEAACDLLQVILDSQFMGKEAPQLYALLCYYLKKIPETANPWLLTASFRLKLLKHDGLVCFPFICNVCGLLLESEAFVQGAEGWCITHQPNQGQLNKGQLNQGQYWSSADTQTIYLLTESQSYKEICLLDVSPKLQSKITLFFKECLQSSS